LRAKDACRTKKNETTPFNQRLVYSLTRTKQKNKSQTIILFGNCALNLPPSTTISTHLAHLAFVGLLWPLLNLLAPLGTYGHISAIFSHHLNPINLVCPFLLFLYKIFKYIIYVKLTSIKFVRQTS
jgi:hypothetical protein